MPDNTILATIVTSGASDQTAKQDKLRHGGVQASRTMAETDLGRVRLLIAKFNAAAADADLPPALLAAIASRESRCGNVLDGHGFGDAEQAFGVMQVDKRSHNLHGLPDPHSQQHIDQAAGILDATFAQTRRKFADESPARQLLAAVAAYNCGLSKVNNTADADRGTTGHDYSNDVWARAQFYAEQWPVAEGGVPTA